jgi:hypothetical protein
MRAGSVAAGALRAAWRSMSVDDAALRELIAAEAAAAERKLDRRRPDGAGALVRCRPARRRLC